MTDFAFEALDAVDVANGFCTDKGTATDATIEVVAKGALLGDEYPEL